MGGRTMPMDCDVCGGVFDWGDFGPVLAEWEEVWEAAGRPGALGESKARAVRRLFERDVCQEHDL